MPTLPSSLRVLVIEDDAASRQAIAEALRESQHTVFEAADGPAGLAIALKEPLDAVVLDLKLPRMDGKVVAMTGCTSGIGFVAARSVLQVCACCRCVHYRDFI